MPRSCQHGICSLTMTLQLAIAPADEDTLRRTVGWARLHWWNEHDEGT